MTISNSEPQTSDENQPRRVRFGLRQFLVVVAIVCIGFGWISQFATQNSRATKFLESEEVHYRYFRARFNNQATHPEILAPAWQRRLLGDEYFLKIKVLALSGPQASDPDFWKKLGKYKSSFQDVELVVIWCKGELVSDQSISTLSMMHGLSGIYVTDGQVSSHWLSQCATLKNLNILKISSPSHTPIDFKSLAGLKQTSAIVLDHCGLSLEDAEYLRDQLRSTMIVVLENNQSNLFN